MKLTRRGKIVLGSLLVAIFVFISGVVGTEPADSAKASPVTLMSKAMMKEKALEKYENADSLTDKELVGLLKAVGFVGDHLKQAWAIAKKESHGRPLAYNGNRKTGDSSYGLFQVNMIGSLGEARRDKFRLDSNADLLNPVINAQVAYHMSDGGKNWASWKGVRTERVREWLSKYPESGTINICQKGGKNGKTSRQNSEVAGNS